MPTCKFLEIKINCKFFGVWYYDSMKDSQVCCAHCRVVLKHIDHKDGTRSDYWECESGCGCKFQPFIPNSHIVVGEGHRCLCGMYKGIPIGCGEILAALRILNRVINDLTEARP